MRDQILRSLFHIVSISLSSVFSIIPHVTSKCTTFGIQGASIKLGGCLATLRYSSYLIKRYALRTMTVLQKKKYKKWIKSASMSFPSLAGSRSSSKRWFRPASALWNRRENPLCVAVSYRGFRGCGFSCFRTEVTPWF